MVTISKRNVHVVKMVRNSLSDCYRNNERHGIATVKKTSVTVTCRLGTPFAPGGVTCQTLIESILSATSSPCQDGSHWLRLSQKSFIAKRSVSAHGLPPTPSGKYLVSGKNKDFLIFLKRTTSKVVYSKSRRKQTKSVFN